MTQGHTNLNLGIIKYTLLESSEQMKMIAKQQAVMANHQVMMQAPAR
jgi:hypothetical protein